VLNLLTRNPYCIPIPISFVYCSCALMSCCLWQFVVMHAARVAACACLKFVLSYCPSLCVVNIWGEHCLSYTSMMSCCLYSTTWFTCKLHFVYIDTVCSKACSRCSGSSSADCTECAENYISDAKGVCKRKFTNYCDCCKKSMWY